MSNPGNTFKFNVSECTVTKDHEWMQKTGSKTDVVCRDCGVESAIGTWGKSECIDKITPVSWDANGRCRYDEPVWEL